jgi:hypothetical protein
MGRYIMYMITEPFERYREQRGIIGIVDIVAEWIGECVVFKYAVRANRLFYVG